MQDAVGGAGLSVVRSIKPKETKKKKKWNAMKNTRVLYI